MRTELNSLVGYSFNDPFEVLDILENKIAKYFGSKHAVLTDCCTHALELSLRILNVQEPISVPLHTYMSVPMMLSKLGINWYFKDETWVDFYQLGNYPIYDAAVLWKENSYIPDSYMCLSFQHKKHLKIGRGGAILLDNKDHYNLLKKLRYDGRDLTKKHIDDNVETIGYHYYMTPEDAALGIMQFDKVYNQPVRQWSWKDYKNLKEYKVFKDAECK